MSWPAWLGGSGDTDKALQTSGALSREVFIKFATQCKSTFSSPEFLLELTDAVKTKKENPDDHIEKMQFQLFQSLGIQGHFGMNQLRLIQRRFGQDADVMQAFMELVSSEEQVLDQIELSPEALAGKQAVGEQLQQFQAQMWQLSREVPEAKQAELMEAVADSMKEAANQVPTSEGATPEEAQAATREQIRIACDALSRRGFPVPAAAAVPPCCRASGGACASACEAVRAGAQPSAGVGGAAVASSAMTAAEQERFLSTMGAAPEGTPGRRS